MRDAQLATDLILCLPEGARPVALLAKAYARRSQSLKALGRTVQALKSYAEGLAECREAQDLCAATRLALDDMPLAWLAKYWAHKVEAAQARHALSSRDGMLLRPVPSQRRLSEDQVRLHLECTLQECEALLEESRDLICGAWARGRAPGRAEAAFFRGFAYLNAEDSEQAEKDATVALVYGPKAEDGTSLWLSALMLRSAAHEARGANVPAVLDAARAADIDPEDPRPTCSLERLLRRVPEHYAEAVRSGGAAALEAVLAAEKERAMPEIMRPRPKYYYYYEWMKKRIEARHPELPEAVVDKLLTLDANELDLLLQYPAAVDQTVGHLMGIMEREGEEALATRPVPLLSWDQVQELKSQDEGRPLQGGPAPQALLPAPLQELAGGGAPGATLGTATAVPTEPKEQSAMGACEDEYVSDDEGSLSIDLDESLFELD